MKIRKQTYSLDQYLKQLRNETIRTDQDCQRLSGQWNANMVNELIYTVLTNNYIPPIILGEEVVSEITRLWVIDGLQRSSTLAMFRFGNTKITKNLDEYMVTYQRKVLDESGKPKRDEQNELVWESVEYDIRNKTYAQLPEELKDRFNGYQIETAIHQDCDISEISKLVRKYNNHTAMNTNQKSFTYMDNFAADVRRITENRFFLDVYAGSQKGKINGTFERLAADSVLLCNYPDEYRKETRKNFEWLNENAYISDFEGTNGLLTRLTASVENTEETRALFDVKHTHIFVAAFKVFTELGRADEEFNGFLHWFVSGGNATEIDGKTWNSLNDTAHSTRDKNVVLGKLVYLETLMKQYSEKIRQAA